MIRCANPSPRPAESEPKSADDYTVALTAKTRRRLIELDAYLENAASPDIATAYVDVSMPLSITANPWRFSPIAAASAMIFLR